MSASDIDFYVGQRMRQRREFLGVSQGRLGRHLGLTFSQVQKYEKGANRIGAGRLHQLSVILRVPVQYFFDGLAGAVSAKPEGGPDADRAELALLDNAFLAISDGETRRSIIALVCSLATPAAASIDRRERAVEVQKSD